MGIPGMLPVSEQGLRMKGHGQLVGQAGVVKVLLPSVQRTWMKYG